MRTIHLLLALTSLAACGGDDPSGDADLCAAICEHDKQCDGTTTCAPCDFDQDRLRTEARTSITACYEALACGASDDGCFVDAAPARDLDDQFAEICLDAAATCGFTDDLCVLSPLFETVHVEAAIACFDGTCPATGCLEAAFGFE